MVTSATETNTSSKKDRHKHYTSKIYLWGSIWVETSSAENPCRSFLDQNKSDSSFLKKIKQTAFDSISCGKNHISMVTTHGELYMMGSNTNGQLGLPPQSAQVPSVVQDEPVRLGYFLNLGLKVAQVACGHGHSVAVLRCGSVFAWGYGKFGALGLCNY